MVFFISFLSLAMMTSTSLLAQSFSDEAPMLGLAMEHTVGAIDDGEWGTGAAWLDYDDDGDLDLYVSNRSGLNKFYESQIAQGSDIFFDRTGILNMGCISIPGTSITCDGAGMSVADYNNDGYPDIYLSTAQLDVFYENTGGAFSDVTATVLGAGSSQLTGYNRGTSVTWLDFDNDGYLDLYISNHIPALYYEGTDPGPLDTNDYLLHNNNGISFEDASFLLDDYGVRWGSSFIGGWTDYDNDGDFDLVVTNDCTGIWPISTIVYENLGPSTPGDWTSWQFDTVQVDVGLAKCDNSMGIAIGDINHDSYMEVAWSDIGPMQLWKNNGGSFTDISASSGVNGQEDQHYSWGINLADFDNDTWLDLILVSGYLSEEMAGQMQELDQPNYYFHNDGSASGGETFTDMSTSENFSDNNRARTSVVADYDLDGDLDVFIVNYDASCQLKKNNYSGDNHYLIIDLEGVISNRDGIGSKIRIEHDGVTQYAESRSGSSLGGGDSPYIHFGLGSSAMIDLIEVTWPSGIIQTVQDIPSDTLIDILEDQLLPSKRLELSSLQVGRSIELSWVLDDVSATDMVLRKTGRNGVVVDSVIIEAVQGKTSYQYVDKEPRQGLNYYQVLAGDYYSNIVKEKIDYKPLFSLFPTISSGPIQLQIGADDAESIEIYSTSGALVFSRQIDSGESSINIDLGYVPVGLYMCVLSSKTGVSVGKVVIAR